MFNCDECQQTFCRKYGLRRHLTTIHKRQLQPVKLGRPMVSGDAAGSKTRVCNVCGASFSNRQNLYHHRRKKHRTSGTASVSATSHRAKRSSVEKFAFNSTFGIKKYRLYFNCIVVAATYSVVSISCIFLLLFPSVSHSVLCLKGAI